MLAGTLQRNVVPHNGIGVATITHLVHGWPFRFREWQSNGGYDDSPFLARLPIGNGVIHKRNRIAFVVDFALALVAIAGFATCVARNRSRLPNSFSTRGLFVFVTLIAILIAWAIAFVDRRWAAVRVTHDRDWVEYLLLDPNTPLDYWIATIYVIGLPFALWGCFDIITFAMSRRTAILRRDSE